MRLIFKNLFILSIGLFGLSVYIGHQPALAYTSKIQQLFNVEMPEFDTIPEDEFKDSTFLHSDTPFGDETMAYEVRIPNGWSEPEGSLMSNYSLSSNILGQIAMFYSPPRLMSVRSKFQIKALRLEYEITAEQWLLQYVLDNGLTLQGLKTYNEDKVGSLHVYLDEGETYVVRSIAQINGKRMIFVQYVVPANQWNKEASMVAQSLETFTLLNPDDSMIEDMQTHLILDIASFKYPVSWQIDTQPIRNIERINVAINNYNERQKQLLDGQIRAELVAANIANDLEEQLEIIRQDFRRRGLVIGELMYTIEDNTYSEDVHFGFVDVYEAIDTNNNSIGYEVWVGVLALNNYYGFVTLMTPSRDSEFFTWARNVSAYEIVTRSMEMQERAFGEQKEK